MVKKLRFLFPLLFTLNVPAMSAPLDLAAYKDAGVRLSAMISAAEAGTKLQQLRNQQFTNLVDALADGERLLGNPPYHADQLNTLLDICGVANKASVSLMLFDLKDRINPKGAPQEIAAAIGPLMISNTLVFQDELIKLHPFLFRCLAAEIQPITEFTLSLKPEEFTEVRRQGLAQMRASILQVYSTCLGLAINNLFREDYRVALLSTMAQTAAAFASITAIADRHSIADAVERAAQDSIPPYRAHLQVIAKAFRDKKCDGLCAVH